MNVRVPMCAILMLHARTLKEVIIVSVWMVLLVTVSIAVVSNTVISV